MTKSNFKIFSYLLITVFLTLGLSISFQSLLAVWLAPSANPPGNNTDEPLNKGSSAQIKGGPLFINYDNSPVTPFGLAVYGKVGIGTAVPRTALELSGDGAILAIGTFDEGWIEPNLGAGARMLWYPNKVAFRAGYVSGGQWNDANIGIASVAFGAGTTARGYASAAFGGSTSASGQNSVAFGNNAVASGDVSAALGFNIMEKFS